MTADALTSDQTMIGLAVLAGVGLLFIFTSGAKAGRMSERAVREVTRIGGNAARMMVTAVVIVGVQWAALFATTDPVVWAVALGLPALFAGTTGHLDDRATSGVRRPRAVGPIRRALATRVHDRAAPQRAGGTAPHRPRPRPRPTHLRGHPRRGGRPGGGLRRQVRRQPPHARARPGDGRRATRVPAPLGRPEARVRAHRTAPVLPPRRAADPPRHDHRVVHPAELGGRATADPAARRPTQLRKAALRAGVPVKVVSERLGHASVSFTQDIYMHVIPGMDEHAAQLAATAILGKTASYDSAPAPSTVSTPLTE
jgi:hypothetical protein